MTPEGDSITGDSATTVSLVGTEFGKTPIPTAAKTMKALTKQEFANSCYFSQLVKLGGVTDEQVYLPGFVRSKCADRKDFYSWFQYESVRCLMLSGLDLTDSLSN